MDAYAHTYSWLLRSSCSNVALDTILETRANTHYLVDDVLLLLELLLVFLQELLVLLLDHQLLQGLGLSTLLLGQGGRLGSSEGTVATREFGDGG